MPSTIDSEPLNVCHLPALMYGAAMAWASRRTVAPLSAPWQRFLATAKVALSLRDVNLGIWEDTISIVSGEAADVIGVEVRDQDEVDLLRRIARAAEAGRQATERFPTIPGAGAKHRRGSTACRC